MEVGGVAICSGHEWTCLEWPFVQGMSESGHLFRAVLICSGHEWKCLEWPFVQDMSGSGWSGHLFRA